MRSQEASDQRKNPKTNIHGGRDHQTSIEDDEFLLGNARDFSEVVALTATAEALLPQPTQESIKETGRSELRKKWSRVVRFYDFLRLLPLQRPEKGSEKERCGS